MIPAMRRLIALVLAVLAGGAVPAGAFVIEERTLPGAVGNGIALGPDGTFWVAGNADGSVVRIAPDGTIVGRYLVGANPQGVINGPGNRIWVSVTGARKLVWFDAAAPAPTAHPVTIGGDCGPAALAPANGRVYFSLPCDPKPRLGYVNDDGSGTPALAAAGGGLVFDLEAVGGKLFAPDFKGGVVRRVGADLDVETTVDAANGSLPDGVVSDGTNVYFTEWGAGKIGRFPVTQDSGKADEVKPAGGTLKSPFGIVVGGDGRLYVTGTESSNVVRMNTDGTDARFYPVDDSQPFWIVNGPDGDLWFSDVKRSRILRLVDTPPRVTTTTAGEAVGAIVDPRGNETQVVFDSGPTTGYGQTSAPQTVAAGTAPVAVAGPVFDLAPGATLHVRARATSAEGETAGNDVVITAPAATPSSFPPPVTRIAAKTKVTVKARRKTVVEKVVISGLVGTETATISCTGKTCPFKTRTFKLEAGTRTFGKRLFKGRRLKKGVKITVAITAPGRIGTSTVLTVRRGKKPKVKRT